MSEWKGPWKCSLCGYEGVAEDDTPHTKDWYSEGECNGKMFPYDRRAPDPGLLALLREAWDRMDRARSILRDPTCGGHADSNWGMLDTSMDRAALEEKP